MDTDWLTRTPALLHVESKHGLPDYVKTATWPAADDLPLTAFADTEQRLPIHSKAAAWCSAIWCAANADLVDDTVIGRVKKACDAHGATADLPELQNLFDYGQEKQAASPDQTYALVIPNAREFGVDADVLELMPLSTMLDVEDSSAELDKSAALGKLPPEMIREAAVNIKKAAAKFDVKLPVTSTAERLGHERYADLETAAELLERRASVVDATAMTGYREVLEFLKTAGMEQTVIEGLLDLDAVNGVTYGFGKMAFQPTPWEIVYSGPTEEDVMKLARSSVLVADCLLPLEALKAVSDATLDMRLSADTASIVKQARVADAPHAAKLIAGLDETRQLQVLDLLLEHA